MTVISFKKIGIFFLITFALPVFSQSSWLSNSYFIRKNATQVRDLENYLFTPKTMYDIEEEQEFKIDLKTNTFLIVKDGKIIYEKYSRGHDKNRPQKLWSISKSVTNLLVGIALKEGRLSLQDNLCKFFKDSQFQMNCSKITIEDLLGWSSGIHWREHFNNPLSSSAFNLIYTYDGYMDSSSFILSHPLIKAPGSSWHYSSADSNLLMAVLSKVYSKDEYSALPWIKLFNELGIQNAHWDRDNKGVFNGCCSLYLTTREVARIGEFMLNEGYRNGRNLLPDYWIEKYVTRISPSFLKEPILIREQFVPGYHWWVNQSSQHGKVHKPRALIDAPEDLYMAIGFAGQLLFIIPSMNTVVIRTGHISNNYIDVNAVIGMSLSIIKGETYHSPTRDEPVPFKIGEEYDPPKEYNPSATQALNNLIAKEMCNCIFIEKGTEPECQNQIKSYKNKIQTISVSYSKKRVSVSLARILQYARASFSPRYGCQLFK